MTNIYRWYCTFFFYTLMLNLIGKRHMQLGTQYPLSLVHPAISGEKDMISSNNGTLTYHMM